MPPDTVGYHKVYSLSAANELVEQPGGEAPRAGSVAAQLEDLRQRRQALNARLAAMDVGPAFADLPPVQAGIYPLAVTRFTCSCEHGDDDGMCAQLADRLGNLRLITEVPFMRRGDMVFAIRSHGLVDPGSGRAESVDALFGGGIYWVGTLDERRYSYDLLMFRSGKDQCVGRMTESIDLSRKLADIDPGLYQAEVAFHLQTESDDANGRPTLSRTLERYGSPEQIAQVAACYAASAAFGRAVAGNDGQLKALADAARRACQAVPGKRYYQAYDAFLQGMSYDPR